MYVAMRRTRDDQFFLLLMGNNHEPLMNSEPYPTSDVAVEMSMKFRNLGLPYVDQTDRDPE